MVILLYVGESPLHTSKEYANLRVNMVSIFVLVVVFGARLSLSIYNHFYSISYMSYLYLLSFKHHVHFDAPSFVSSIYIYTLAMASEGVCLPSKQ